MLLVTAFGIKDRDGERERQTDRKPPLFFNSPVSYNNPSKM